MNISLNIILDSISHYRNEVHIELPTDKTFRRISLLPNNTKIFDCDGVTGKMDADTGDKGLVFNN